MKIAGHQLSARVRMSGEAFISYSEDMFWLWHRDNPNMVEAENVTTLMKGVVVDAFRHLVSKYQLLVETLTEGFRKLEEAQRARLAV